MRSHLLGGIFPFLKHSPALEIFLPKLWIFQQFLRLGERGGGGVGAEMACVIGTGRRRTKHLQ